MTEPRIISRPVAGDADFWRVREFLQATVPDSPFGHNWDVRRWDGSYFYNPNGRWEDGWETRARIWETGEGEIVAAAHGDGRGEAAFQVHPAYRFLEGEMLDWAEVNVAAGGEGAGGSGFWPDASIRRWTAAG
jgi:hypothetical protein